MKTRIIIKYMEGTEKVTVSKVDYYIIKNVFDLVQLGNTVLSIAIDDYATGTRYYKVFTGAEIKASWNRVHLDF